MINKCLFPVAGYGTRFLPATKSMPKEMLPIVNKPLVQYGVEEALAAMKKDKKARAGTLKFIVPTSLGTVVQRTDITDGQALRALASLKE